jgi:hypothetical protein
MKRDGEREETEGGREEVDNFEGEDLLPSAGGKGACFTAAHTTHRDQSASSSRATTNQRTKFV